LKFAVGLSCILNARITSLRAIAPRVQWLFVVRTTRNAFVEIKYIEINSVPAGVRGLLRCNSIVANKTQRAGRREAGPEKFGTDGASRKAISATGCGRNSLGAQRHTTRKVEGFGSAHLVCAQIRRAAGELTLH
jgi:hypothetical protein